MYLNCNLQGIITLFVFAVSRTYLEDHNYSNYEDTSFTIDQQYADDIGWASTAEHIIENIEKKNTTEKLKERNLLLNQSKPKSTTSKKTVMIAGKM